MITIWHVHIDDKTFATDKDDNIIAIRDIGNDEFSVEWSSSCPKKHALRDSIWTRDDVTNGERNGRFFIAIVQRDNLGAVMVAIRATIKQAA